MVVSIATVSCASRTKSSVGFPTVRFPDLPIPTGRLAANLVGPTAFFESMQEFLYADGFFPRNATRVYDSGDPPVSAGKATVYTNFPDFEPCPSPDRKWQWRFRFSGETSTHKVVGLENEHNQKQGELLLYGTYVAILWNESSEFSAITSWDDEVVMRTDVYDVLKKSSDPVAMDMASMAGFFSSAELEGNWSTRARGWKSGSVLVVRCVKISTKSADKLCAAEFSIDLKAGNPISSFRLLRAFVVAPQNDAAPGSRHERSLPR